MVNSKIKKKMFVENIVGYCFMVPAIIILGMFLIYPTINLVYLGFTDYNLIRGSGNIIGFKNYIGLFKDGEFLESFIITLKFAVLIIPVQTAIALIMANFVNASTNFNRYMRTIYFLPVIISSVAVCYIWKQIYSPSFGLANSFLRTFGIERLEFLSSQKQALIWVAITCIWKSWGYFTFIYLGALQGIPREIRESAKIDGANSIQEFFYITIPSVKRISIFILIITSIDAIKLFAPIFTMTGGGPNGSTNAIMFYTWRQAFRLQKIGFAAAMTTILLLIVIVIMFFYVLNMRATKKNLGKI